MGALQRFASSSKLPLAATRVRSPRALGRTASVHSLRLTSSCTHISGDCAVQVLLRRCHGGLAQVLHLAPVLRPGLQYASGARPHRWAWGSRCGDEATPCAAQPPPILSHNMQQGREGEVHSGAVLPHRGVRRVQTQLHQMHLVRSSHTTQQVRELLGGPAAAIANAAARARQAAGGAAAVASPLPAGEGDCGSVTESNLLAHMGIIEQRTNELLQVCGEDELWAGSGQRYQAQGLTVVTKSGSVSSHCPL
jgi:hypothetical protein